jgi:ribosome-binding ATPase YchF (GTP1/OBG family)
MQRLRNHVFFLNNQNNTHQDFIGQSDLFKNELDNLDYDILKSNYNSTKNSIEQSQEKEKLKQAQYLQNLETVKNFFNNKNIDLLNTKPSASQQEELNKQKAIKSTKEQIIFYLSLENK